MDLLASPTPQLLPPPPQSGLPLLPQLLIPPVIDNAGPLSSHQLLLSPALAEVALDVEQSNNIMRLRKIWMSV